MVAMIVVHIEEHMGERTSVEALAILAVRPQQIGDAVELAALEEHLALDVPFFIDFPDTLRISIDR